MQRKFGGNQVTPMGPIDALQSVLTNFADFSGRASRAEYWWFVAIWTIAYFVVLGLQRNRAKWPEYAFIAVSIIPVMSVSFRRLQDIGHPGWWSVVELVLYCALAAAFAMSLPKVEEGDIEIANPTPMIVTGILTLIATIAIIWHYTLPSEPGPNEHGPNPHEVTQ